MQTEMGYFRLHADGVDYFLNPTISNMMKLGGGDDLMGYFDALHGIGRPDGDMLKHLHFLNSVNIARRVICACCEDAYKLTIGAVATARGVKLRIGTGKRFTASEQVAIASGLIRHGVCGVRKKKVSAKNNDTGEVDLWEIVHLSMAHLGLTKEQVLDLTMTEVVRLWDAKFPPDDKTGGITDEEYDDAMSRLAKINEIRDGK